NEGLVTIREAMNTENISNVTIAGDNAAGIVYGFKFSNISYRAIVLSGRINGVTLKSMSFSNVKDYCITGADNNGKNLHYDGSANTRNERFKILNCEFDQAGTLFFGGGLSSSSDAGLFKDVEIAYNVFRNTEWGSVCSFENVQDFN